MKKKWHRMPIALVVGLLVLTLTAGIALATGFAFFTGTVQAEVEEPIALGEFSTWDNLVPYGSNPSAVWERDGENWYAGTLDDITITLGGTAEVPVITIATIEGYGGVGFVAGEWIVIPLNLRNGGGGVLTLGAIVESIGGLEVDSCWLTNTGVLTEPHPDGDLNRDFTDDGSWAPLSGWEAEIEGFGGESGSARLGAQVLFVRIRAPGDIAPSGETPHTLNIALTRS